MPQYAAEFDKTKKWIFLVPKLSKLLTSCLTAVKNHVIRYCEKVYERSGKNLFWSVKNSGEVLNKLKSRGIRATSLSTDFSTLYTTLPHNLIKEKPINLIELTFKREGSPYIACNERRLSSLLEAQNDINHLALKFSVCVKERQDRLPTMYWLPKLHKRPYKARFIANSSSCTTTELSKLLTSCLTAVKNHVIRYCEKVYERSVKNLFWSIKNSGEVLNKLKSRGFPVRPLCQLMTFPHSIPLCPII